MCSWQTPSLKYSPSPHVSDPEGDPEGGSEGDPEGDPEGGSEGGSEGDPEGDPEGLEVSATTTESSVISCSLTSERRTLLTTIAVATAATPNAKGLKWNLVALVALDVILPYCQDRKKSIVQQRFRPSAWAVFTMQFPKQRPQIFLLNCGHVVMFGLQVIVLLSRIVLGPHLIVLLQIG